MRLEKEVFKEWQNRWDKIDGETARWIKRLIPDLQKWVNRDRETKCEEDDTAEHTLFACAEWRIEKR